MKNILLLLVFTTILISQGFTQKGSQGSANHDAAVVFPISSGDSSGLALVNVFPLPFGNEIQINDNQSESRVLSAEIYDITGNKVLTIPISGVNKRIDTSSLSAGVYLLKLEGEKGTITKKVTKKAAGVS